MEVWILIETGAITNMVLEAFQESFGWVSLLKKINFSHAFEARDCVKVTIRYNAIENYEIDIMCQWW